MKHTLGIPVDVLVRQDEDELARYEKPFTAIEIEEREQEIAAFESARSAHEWREKRIAAYPPISDQLDALMKWIARGDETELQALAQMCMRVKENNPKPLG